MTSFAMQTREELEANHAHIVRVMCSDDECALEYAGQISWLIKQIDKGMSDEKIREELDNL